jgi:hypothetical protein
MVQLQKVELISFLKDQVEPVESNTYEQGY